MSDQVSNEDHIRMQAYLLWERDQQIWNQMSADKQEEFPMEDAAYYWEQAEYKISQGLC